MTKANDMAGGRGRAPESDRFLVTSHEAPDGDALGSLLATELALRSAREGRRHVPRRAGAASR